MPERAARLSDHHTCPMVEAFPQPDGTVLMLPHVGGPIQTAGSPDVRIAGQFAATVGSGCRCTGVASIPGSQSLDLIVNGSSTVRINGKAAARRGDRTAHGGTIVTGAPTVLIGG